MRISMGFGIAVLAACMGTAVADEYTPPPMKDGLWETRTVHRAAGNSAGDTAVKMCLSKELTQSSKALSDRMRKTNECTSTIVQRSGDTVVAETRCAKGPNAGRVSRITYSHTGDIASHMEMHVLRGGTDDVTVMDMKYLSSCPAGMKPGDMIMPDGKVFSGG